MKITEDTADFLNKRFSIYILGAGFSRPAGLPLGNELWPEILQRARNSEGRAYKNFDHDMQSYIEYRAACDGKIISPGGIDFEEFMAFLDVEHYLGLRGSDTWSSDGNETQILVKTTIGEILSERTPQTEDIPDIYLSFVKLLKPQDVILTFNYDVVLERALDAARIPYRLFPNRYREVRGGSGIIDDSRQEITVLKMHGSIDWFDKTHYAELEAVRLRSGLSPGRYHPVFSNSKELGVTPLVDGPRFPGDPLKEIYRVTDSSKLYKRDLLFQATPVLMNPSSLKLLYAKLFQDFWDGTGQMGTLNFGMTIIGFSMPPHDEYLRQVIYRLVTNFQTRYWGENQFKHKKTPLVLIDFRSNEETQRELLDRYRFIDLRKAITHWDGLDASALATLKANAFAT